MKDLKIAVLGAVLVAATAAPLLADPRLCGNGLPPRLSGDAFSPVECSTATMPVVLLPGLPARATKASVVNLRDLEGRWEGSLVHALGRYELMLTVKTNWRGQIEAVLDTKELQFRDRLSQRMILVPDKERGAFAATLTTTLVPEASLAGKAVIADAPGPEGAPVDRQLDLTFANGATHRIVFALKDKSKNEMRARIFSAIPSAPLQTMDLVLTKTKREKL